MPNFEGVSIKQKIKLLGTQAFMNKQIPVILGGFGENQKVVIDKMVAEIHNMKTPHVRENINKNIKRFKENVDFIDLKKVIGDTDNNILLTLGYTNMEISKANNIYLLSERGYAKLIKIMDTDLAWEIHDKLIDEYFQLREGKQHQRLMSMEDIIIYQMQQSKMMKEQLEQTQAVALEAKAGVEGTKEELQNMRAVISLDTTSWRTDATDLINKIATYRGGTHNIYQETRREAYELLSKRMGVNLEQRLINKRRRMADEGISKSKRDKLNKIDVIADDKKLIEGFVAIVKEMAIRYGVA